MLIIGHRGAAGLESENSLSSFKKAQELGVGMIETDLRQKDGVIVLSHDKVSANVVTLGQLLETATVPLNLELKECGFEAQMLQAIKSFSSEVLISSKYPSVLKKVRALDEKAKLGLILGSANFFLLPLIPGLDKTLNLYSVHPKQFLASKTIIRYLKGLGKKVYVWTVNDPKIFQDLNSLQVDGVFTDRPDIIHN